MKINVTRDIKAGDYTSDDLRVSFSIADPMGITLDLQPTSDVPAPTPAPPPVDPPPPDDDDPPDDQPPLDDPPPADTQPTPDPQSLPPAKGDGTHHVRAYVVIGAKAWSAIATVGEDYTVAGTHMALVDADGNAHPGLQLHAWADCCEVGASKGRGTSDYAGSLRIDYDDTKAFDAAAVTFPRGAVNATVRYGSHQPTWHAVDPTLFPHYASSDTPLTLADLTKYDWSYNGMGLASTAGMHMTGMREDIAFIPGWDVPFVVQPSDASYAVVRKAADHCGVWAPIYMIDPDTGHPFDISKYPLTTFLPATSGGFSGDPIPKYAGANSQHVTNSACLWDQAHETGYAFVAAAATGSARDRWHCSVWANAMLTASSPYYREQTGIWAHIQERATAWCLRSLFLACYLSDMPDYFQARMEEQRTLGEKLVNHPLGFQATYVTRNLASGATGTAPWEENFTRVVLGVIAKKMPAWHVLSDRLKVFLTTIFASPYWQFAANYILAVTKPDGTPVTTIEDALRLGMSGKWSDADLDSLLAPDVTQQTVDMLIKKYMPATWLGKPGDFTDNYPYSMQGYAAITVAAVAAQCGSGSEWDKCMSVPTARQYAKGWQWHIVPETLP